MCAIPRSSTTSRVAGPCAALLAVCTFGAFAQSQVNTQLNTEVYGRGLGTMRQTNVPMYQPALRSDAVHDAFLSGSLRSDLRGEYMLRGPLAPGGITSYIPASPRPYGSLSAPGLPSTPGYTNAPFSVQAPGSSYGLPSTGSLNYRPPQSSWGSAPPPTSYAGSPSPFGAPSYGSLRYGR
jgi:hypothetical protein